MVAIAVPLLLAGVAGAQTPGFWSVGLPAGGTQSQSQALSADGKLAAGVSSIDGTPYNPAPGFIWNRSNGRYDFGLEPGMPLASDVWGMSSDGTMLAGRMYSTPGYANHRAYRRVGNGPLQDLGVLPGQVQAQANGISGDGTIVVGSSERPDGPYTGVARQAFRWTEATGMQGLGYLRPNGTYSVARAISRDGSTVVGVSQSDGMFGPIEAFAWRKGEGMRYLAALPGAPHTSTTARAVNADGSVVVGASPIPAGPTPPFIDHGARWMDGVIQDLGTVPGFTRSHALAVDDSGDVIACSVQSGQSVLPAVWTPATRTVLFTDYLAAHGIVVPSHFVLGPIAAISGDGLTFTGVVGDYSLPVPRPVGYIVTIPTPATGLLLVPLVFCSRRRHIGVARARMERHPKNLSSPSRWGLHRPRATLGLARMVAITLPLLAGGAVAAQTPGFWTVGWPPGGTSSITNALSQDGSIAAGVSSIPPQSAPGLVWTRATGRYDFGLEPGMPLVSGAWAISSDGNVLAGRMQSTPGYSNYRAYRRVGNGPLQDLGVLPGEVQARANGISGDGGTVVGSSERPDGPYTDVLGEAFRWTESTGMQGLGYLRPNGTRSVANAISRDGATIVGESQSDGMFGPQEAFTWRAGEGMRYLPPLAGAPHSSTTAEAVNADGSVVVGASPIPGGPNPPFIDHAARWVNGVIQDLGTVPGFTRSHARAVDDSGDVIGCSVQGGPNLLPAVWTPATGMLLLTDFLSSNGVQLPSSFKIVTIEAISGDGLTFAGRGQNLTINEPEGWIATVPSPGTAVILIALPLFSRHRRG